MQIFVMYYCVTSKNKQKLCDLIFIFKICKPKVNTDMLMFHHKLLHNHTFLILFS